MKIVLTIAGSLLLILGLISMVTPIPGGTLFIAVGAAMLVCTSPRAQAWIRRQRANHERFNKTMGWIEKKAPSAIEDALSRTRP